MDNIDFLNELLRKFVYEDIYVDGKYVDNALNYSKSLMKILFKNVPNICSKKYKKKISIEKSIEYSLVFLNSIDFSYANYLDERIKDGTIEFIDINDVPEEEYVDSYSSYENNKRIIKIYYESTFGDCYTIIHEILHDMNLGDNLDDDYANYTRYIFTETVSFLGTLFAKDYYMANFSNKKELLNNQNDEYVGLYSKVLNMDFKIKLLDKYINNGYINKIDIAEILCDKSEIYVEVAIKSISEMKQVNDLMLEYEERYLTGTLIACYINNLENKKEIFMSLNEMLKGDYSVIDIFDYLDLDTTYDSLTNIFELTDEALKKIEKTFKKEIKKL